MIAYLSGTLQAQDLRCVVVMTSGVGYRVFMPLSDISRLNKLGSEVALHIHTHVREDSLELFGFLSLNGLSLFEQLISVSGIGPKLAMGLLSSMDADRLTQTIVSSDHAALTRLPGIGAKTAQRLVLELKDKLKSHFAQPLFMKNSPISLVEDLRSAISNLGYKPHIVDKAIQSVEPMVKQGLPLESLVKEALRQLA